MLKKLAVWWTSVWWFYKYLLSMFIMGLAFEVFIVWLYTKR